ncbi:hypothetical protein [Pseudoxanthomonas sp. J35]|uniref:hypothetical protein n=1 Tax=Pseudoxanthomonas sp. J35 TaxID=935852 RepID=UPI00048EA04D|nr:hypothetical protein [Pseudoxanthomonas sp. J35]
MSSSKSQAGVPLDDVAGLFARVGVQGDAPVGYQVFSLAALKAPSAPAASASAAAAVPADPVEPAPQAPALEAVQEPAPVTTAVQAPTTGTLPGMLAGSAAPRAPAAGPAPARGTVVLIDPARTTAKPARTPLEQLFQRLAEGGRSESGGEESPLRRLFR